MDTQTFFEKVLPESGYYVVATPHTTGGFIHTVCDSKEEAAQVALSLDAKGNTVYFAPASFKEKILTNKGMRRGTNVLNLRTQYVDLDVGDGKPYQTAQEALQALVFVCQQLRLPGPMIVSSGRGIHAYWPYDTDVPEAEAKKVASAFAAAATQFGLKHDRTITANLAAVLRPIDTHWRKEDPPRKVTLLRDADPVPFETFKERLSAFVAVESTEQDEWGLSEREFPPSSLEKIAEHCATIAAMRDTQGDVSYNIWLATIAIGKHCTEGLPLLEQWSEKRFETGHANYDVEKKHASIDFGPATCDTFRKAEDNKCEGCPHSCKSPIQLGYAEEAESAEQRGPAEAVANDQQIIPNTELVNQSPSTIPYWPKNFRWDGEMLCGSVKDGDGSVNWVPITNKLFYPFTRIRNEDGTASLLVCVQGLRGRWREFKIDASDLADDFALMRVLGSHEIYTVNKTGKELVRTFLRTIVSNLERYTPSVKTLNSFGWHNDAFVMGDAIVTKSSESRVILSDGIPDNLQGAFKPAGTRDGWVDAIDKIYNRPGAEPYQFTILCGFAAPLVKLVAADLWHGIPVALTGDSGIGKSTTCMAACSMWGKPGSFLISTHKMGTTVNALILQLSIQKNMPLIMDELHGMDQGDLPTLLYALSNGKPKKALTASRRFHTLGAEWDTISFVTSNGHLMSMLAENEEARVEATQVRVFEIQLSESYVRDTFPDLNAKGVIEHDLLSKHYGVVGREYIRSVIRNQDMIAAAIQQKREEMQPTDKEMTRERFYYDLIATVIVAGMVAKKLGLINFNLSKILQWATDHVKTLRSTRKSMRTGIEDKLTSIIGELSRRMVRTKRYPRGRVRASDIEGVDSRVVTNPCARYSSEEKVLVITSRGLQEICHEKKFGYMKLLNELKNGGFIRSYESLGSSETHKKMFPYRGTDLPNANLQATCVPIDITKFEEIAEDALNQVEEEQNAIQAAIEKGEVDDA